MLFCLMASIGPSTSVMGRLDHRTRTFLADMLLATLARDYERLAAVQVKPATCPPGSDGSLC